jgi:AcrR family transcriptional regulator
MPLNSTRRLSLARSPGGTPQRQRVRRGNADDAAHLRRELLAAAGALFAEGGLEAVSVRKVAAHVGVSAMTPYRYFADKAELLVGLWEFVMQGLLARMQTEVGRHTDAAARMRAGMDAFISYWEDHPDRYRLVYMTERTTQREEKSDFTAAAVYGEILMLARVLTADYAKAIGADLCNAATADDLRFTMVIGYLHTTLVVKRYPWADPSVLREACLAHVMAAVTHCLLNGATPTELRPAAKRRRA